MSVAVHEVLWVARNVVVIVNAIGILFATNEHRVDATSNCPSMHRVRLFIHFSVFMAQSTMVQFRMGIKRRQGQRVVQHETEKLSVAQLEHSTKLNHTQEKDGVHF